MLGRMLVGAWLLIQQQCCSVYGDSGSRFRNAALVDPLMRRSPLEKNFMRFGRSSPQTFTRDVRVKDNFMRFGRPVLDPLLSLDSLPTDKNSEPLFGRTEENLDSGIEKSDDGGLSRNRRAKENFMRFGRGEEPKDTHAENDEKSKRQSNFMRFGRNQDGPNSVELPIDAQSLFELPEFSRAARAKENFMRFGRDKERVVRNEKGKQDSFIRFGKSKNADESEYDNCVESTEPRQTRAGDDSFVRFGRGNDKFMRFGKKDEDGTVDNSDKTIPIRVARDQGGIVRNPRQRTQDNGFIRFGRTFRTKRDTHKHKELFHRSSSELHDSRHEQTPGVCESTNVKASTSSSESDCKDGSCKPLYLTWPFYYQPSLYSVLPNVLATPQVSMLPNPQVAHKPKRSRGNLQNFIRLG